MATLRGAVNPAGSSAALSITLTRDVGVVTNDIMVASLYRETSADPTTVPTGWALKAKVVKSTTHVQWVYWKRAEVSEPATYQWVWASSVWTTGAIGAYSGCFTSGDPIECFIQNFETTGDLTVEFLAINTGYTDTMLLYLPTCRDDGNWGVVGTAPNGLANAIVRANFHNVGWADEPKAATGTTGTRTWTITSTPTPTTDTSVILSLIPDTAASSGVQVAVGSFAKPTGAAPVDQTITFVAPNPIFRPRLLILMADRRTVDGGFGGNDTICLGVSNQTEEAAIAMFCKDPPATSATGMRTAGRAGTNAGNALSIIDIPTTSVGVTDECRVVQFNPDGFTLRWTPNTANAWIIRYIAIGGTDFSYCNIGQFAFQTSTGNQSITSVPFQPDMLLFFGAGLTSARSTGNGGQFQFGLAKSASAQAAMVGQSVHASAAADTQRQQSSTRCILGTSPTGGANIECNLVSMLSNGFTINHNLAGTANICFFVAIKGGNHAVGVETQKSGTGTKQTTISPVFTPAGLMLASFNKIAGAGIVAHNRLSLGWTCGSGASQNQTIWGGDTDLADPMSTDQSGINTRCLRLADFDGPVASANADTQFSAFASGSFTLDWVVSDSGVPREFMYWAIGPLAGATIFSYQLSRLGTVVTAVSRIGSLFSRPRTRTGTVSEAVARIGTFLRTQSRNGTVAEVLTPVKVLTRSRTRTGTVATAVSRAGSTWRRALSRTATGMSYTLRNRVMIFARTLTRTGVVSESVVRVITTVIVRALSRIGTVLEALSRTGSTYRRPRTRTGTVLEALSRAGSTYRRPRTRTGTVLEVVSRSGSTYRRPRTRTGTVSEILVAIKTTAIIRLLSRTGTVAVAVARRGNPFARPRTRAGTVSAALSRAGSAYKRAPARTGTVLCSLSRGGSIYRRLLTRTGTIATLVVRVVTVVGVTFLQFGKIIGRFDASKVKNYTIHFQAVIFTTDPSQPVHAVLYDTTTSSNIPGSEITTVSTVPVLVRSGALALPQAEHEYRADFGGFYLGSPSGKYNIHVAEIWGEPV